MARRKSSHLKATLGTRAPRGALAAALGALASLAPAAAPAHHSQQPFFHMERDIELEGIVTAVDFVNPHPIIFLEVTGEDGEAVVWQIEGPTPIYLRRTGWTERSVVAGERIRARGAPPKRPDARILAGREIHKSDGTSLRLYTDDATSVLERGR